MFSEHSFGRTAALIAALCSGLYLFRAPAIAAAGAQESAPVSMPAAEEALRREFPGVLIARGWDRVHIYGVPMTGAESAAAAASNWLASHAGALGAPAAEFVLIDDFDVAGGRFHLFAYAQVRQQLLVEQARVRVLVLHAEEARVVYVAARDVAPSSAGGWPPPAIAKEGVQARIQALPEYRALALWGEPLLAVLPPQRAGAETRLAWKVAGHNGDRAAPASFTFFVDARTGELAHVRDEILHADVSGNVTGLATPGLYPDQSGNAAESAPLPDLLVGVPAAAAYTDAAGDYVITGLSGAAQTLSADMLGRWATVLVSQGSPLSDSEVVTPPETVDFEFNATPAEFDTSQLNGLLHVQATHDFYKARLSSFTGLDFPIDCYVNIADACNAYFDPFFVSINFFNAGTILSNGVLFSCPNTAYSSVITHEYGHFVLNQHGVPQGAFGEGFADALSLLRFEDPIIGYDFFGPDDPVRDIVAANQQYPCAGEIHMCGQVLAGCFWDLKIEMQATLGAEPGLEATRQLFVDWSAITLGGSGSDSAYPETAIEVLAADDDDGMIANGTPNYLEICAAFDAHGIDCPPFDPIAFEFPDGIPNVASADGSTAFAVNVVGLEGTPEPGTGTLHYSLNGGAFSEIALEVVAPNQYLASLPASACGDLFAFYFSAEDTTGAESTSPVGAPPASYSCRVAESVVTAFADDFEGSQGWTVGDSAVPDTAATGIWTRVVPNGTAAQPSLDHSEDPGSLCFVTGQGSIGGGLGEADVDAGKTTLVSPALDLSAAGHYEIAYWRWYSNNTGASPNADVFTVEISDADGAVGTWIEVEAVGPAGAGTGGGWIYHLFRVDDYIVPSAEVRVRFIASDLADPSLVEAAIDDFTVAHFACAPPEAAFVRGDCNVSATLDISDPIFLLEYLFGGVGLVPACDDACDANDDGALGLADVLSGLNAIFLGDALLPPGLGCGADASADGLDCSSAAAGCQ